MTKPANPCYETIWLNKSICALTLGCLVMSCADPAPEEYKASIPSTEIIAEDASRYEVELRVPETETNPNSRYCTL